LLKELIGRDTEELSILESVISMKIMLDCCELTVPERFIIGGIMRIVGKKRTKLRV